MVSSMLRPLEKNFRHISSDRFPLKQGIHMFISANGRLPASHTGRHPATAPEARWKRLLAGGGIQQLLPPRGLTSESELRISMASSSKRGMIKRDHWGKPLRKRYVNHEMAMRQNPKPATPMNIRFNPTTQIKPKMGGDFTKNPRKWDPKTVLTTTAR